GMARDAVRAIQGIRKRLDLHISDRIAVIVEASAEVTAALETHSELIAGETLATSLEFGSAEGAAQVFDPDELPAGTRLAVSRAGAPKRRAVTATGMRPAPAHPRRRPRRPSWRGSTPCCSPGRGRPRSSCAPTRPDEPARSSATSTRRLRRSR